MGRRALPKLDRTVDTSNHHFLLEDVPCPFNPEEFFGRDAPLEIEIGSGKGLFLFNASSGNPDRNYLGVESAKKYAYFAANRFARHERKNAKMISGDGMRFVIDFLEDKSVEGVHVYFPDPWWKERHRRRRVIQPDVIQNIERVLKPLGSFHFWTDVEEYFESALELIADHSSLDGPFEVLEIQPADNMDYRTHFERRMRLNGHPVFRSRFEKSK